MPRSKTPSLPGTQTAQERPGSAPLLPQVPVVPAPPQVVDDTPLPTPQRFLCPMEAEWTDRTLHALNGGRCKQLPDGSVVADKGYTQPAADSIQAGGGNRSGGDTQGAGGVRSSRTHTQGGGEGSKGKYKVLGLSSTSVLRWLGANGFTKEEATKIVRQFCPDVTDITIGIQWRAGKKGADVPTLQRSQAEQLRLEVRG